MEWAWQSSDYDCTAAFKLNKWQILALGIRRSNIRYWAELPGSAGLMTQSRTFRAHQGLPKTRRLFMSFKRPAKA